MLYSLVYHSGKYVSFSCNDLIGLALLFKPLLVSDISVIEFNKDQLQRFIYFIDCNFSRYQLNNDSVMYSKGYSDSFFFTDILPLKIDFELVANFIANEKAIVFFADFDQVIQYIEKSENCSLFLKLIFEI